MKWIRLCIWMWGDNIKIDIQVNLDDHTEWEHTVFVLPSPLRLHLSLRCLTQRIWWYAIRIHNQYEIIRNYSKRAQKKVASVERHKPKSIHKWIEANHIYCDWSEPFCFIMAGWLARRNTDRFVNNCLTRSHQDVANGVAVRFLLLFLTIKCFGRLLYIFTVWKSKSHNTVKCTKK